MPATPHHVPLLDPWPSDEEGPTLRLGDWLVRRGLISRVDLFEALGASFSQTVRLGDALVRSGVLPRAVVEAEAAHHRGFVARAAHACTVQFPLGEQ